LKLWEGLEQDLNYNVMHSKRGLINLFHSDGQRDAFARRGNAMINQGDDAILLDKEGVRDLLPYLDFEQTRFLFMVVYIIPEEVRLDTMP
jgi:sarcosine oxidase subunit beta